MAILGVNHRPADASPYECRFYNPEFSIGSSVVSFIIPCCIVLFVYIRIMVALRKREKVGKYLIVHLSLLFINFFWKIIFK